MEPVLRNEYGVREGKDVRMSAETEIREVIEVAIETEKLGRIFYEKMARVFDKEQEISELFSKLADDESIHERIFRSLLTETPGFADPQRKDESLSFLKVMVLPEMLLNDETLGDRLLDIRTREDALYRALRLEKDTYAYYDAMRDLLGNHKSLDRIIKEEKRHITKLVEYLTTGSKMRGLSDKYAGEHRG